MKRRDMLETMGKYHAALHEFVGEVFEKHGGRGDVDSWFVTWGGKESGWGITFEFTNCSCCGPDWKWIALKEIDFGN